MPSSRHLDVLRYTRVAPFDLERSAHDRGRDGTIVGAGDEQHWTTVGIAFDCVLSPRIEVGGCRLKQRRAG
jgi:hypothetical protein